MKFVATAMIPVQREIEAASFYEAEKIARQWVTFEIDGVGCLRSIEKGKKQTDPLPPLVA